MKFRMLGATAALLMTTAFATAAPFDAAQVRAQLIADGYTHIEIKVGQQIAKVEATKGTTKIETTYDLGTGAVLKTETEGVDEADDDRDDDDDGDDHGGDRDRGDDDGDEDHSGRGGGDDDGDDDRDDGDGDGDRDGDDDNDADEDDGDDDRRGRGDDD